MRHLSGRASTLRLGMVPPPTAAAPAALLAPHPPPPRRSGAQALSVTSALPLHCSHGPTYCRRTYRPIPSSIQMGTQISRVPPHRSQVWRSSVRRSGIVIPLLHQLHADDEPGIVLLAAQNRSQGGNLDLDVPVLHRLQPVPGVLRHALEVEAHLVSHRPHPSPRGRRR